MNELDFVSKIESADLNFDNQKTIYLSHNVHPYWGKFIPQIPNTMIRNLSEKGDLIWDPFGGSGTTALEALFLERNCISTDLNPIGTLSGLVKTAILDEKDIRQIDEVIFRLEYISKSEEMLAAYIDQRFEQLENYIPPLPKLQKWFSENAVSELALLRKGITEGDYTSNVQYILQLSLSRTVGYVSNQQSETQYKAVEKSISVGATVKKFISSLRLITAKVRSMNEALLKNNISVPEMRFLTMDVRSDNIVGYSNPIPPKVDLIVTSPPYPKALDYFVYHRLRLFWLGYDPRILAKKDIGAHVRFMDPRYGFDEYEEEMTAVLDNCYKSLKYGRYAVFVLGNGKSYGKEYNAAERLAIMGETMGFRLMANVERTYPLHKRYFQQKKTRKEKEHILIFRKGL